MAQYNPLSGETLYDIASKLYGGDIVAGLTDLLPLNPSINIDGDLFGAPLNYTPGLKRVKPVIINPPTPSTNQIYLTRKLQNVYDLSIQLYGNMSSIGKLLILFPNLDEGIVLNSPIPLVDEPDTIVQFFNNRIVSTDIAFVLVEDSFELREDGSFELREDSSFELRE